MPDKKLLVPIVDLKRDLYRTNTPKSDIIETSNYHVPMVVENSDGTKDIENYDLKELFRDTDGDVYIPKNVIYVNSEAPEIAGKVYQSISDAVAYTQRPSNKNTQWAISLPSAEINEVLQLYKNIEYISNNTIIKSGDSNKYIYVMEWSENYKLTNFKFDTTTNSQYSIVIDNPDLDFDSMEKNCNVEFENCEFFAKFAIGEDLSSTNNNHVNVIFSKCNFDMTKRYSDITENFYMFWAGGNADRKVKINIDFNYCIFKGIESLRNIFEVHLLDSFLMKFNNCNGENCVIRCNNYKINNCHFDNLKIFPEYYTNEYGTWSADKISKCEINNSIIMSNNGDYNLGSKWTSLNGYRCFDLTLNNSKWIFNLNDGPTFRAYGITLNNSELTSNGTINFIGAAGTTDDEKRGKLYLYEYSKITDYEISSQYYDGFSFFNSNILQVLYAKDESGSNADDDDFAGRTHIGIPLFNHYTSDYQWIKNDSLFSAGAFETVSANKTLSLERNTIRSLIVSADNITITFKKNFSFSREDRDFKQIIKIIKPMNYNITYKFKDTANPDPDKSVGYFNIERRIGRKNSMGTVYTVSRIVLNEITLAGFNYQDASFEFITVTITANSINAESNLGFDIIQIDADSIAVANWSDPS